MGPTRTALLILGLILVLISLGFFGFSALGFAGVVADAEYSLNRNFGVTMGRFGLAAFVAGALLCIPALLYIRRNGLKFQQTARHDADGQ